MSLLVPEQYGDGGIYRVVGTHVSAATGEQRSAMMRFNLDSAEMISLFVLPEENGIVTPRGYDPQPGDQFIFQRTWIDRNSGEWSYSEGDVLTFSDEPLWLDVTPSSPGEFVIGVDVADLDGNHFSREIWLTVEAD